MIEIVFNDSIKGSMKMAKSLNRHKDAKSQVISDGVNTDDAWDTEEGTSINGKSSKKIIGKLHEGEELNGSTSDVIQVGTR